MSSVLTKERLKTSLVLFSASANALSAGAIFTFPLFADSLAEHLKLRQHQLTTIVLAGMMGQYPFAAFVGWAVDAFGPWLCSLVSSAFFSLSLSLFAYEISKTPDDITEPSQSSFHLLTFYFFVAGLGAVFSLFADMFAATKVLPSHPGIASGSSLAFYGLSPLFLSLVASNWFTASNTGLDVTKFLRFLAILSGVVHLTSAVTFRLVPKHAEVKTDISPAETEARPDERTALLPSSNVESLTTSNGTIKDLFRDTTFWALFFVILVTLGSCEMVISNIGTIVLSLPLSIASSGPTPTDMAATQVRLISFTNTATRFLVGPIVDYVSPVKLYTSHVTTHKTRVSRLVFVIASVVILAVTFLVTELFVQSQQTIWILSVGVGIVYGAIFTLLSSIISSVWGPANGGRNFGILTYAIFLGTPIFSYLYAFVSETEDGSVCKGVACWRTTFWVTFVTALFGLVSSIWLWRRWKAIV